MSKLTHFQKSLVNDRDTLWGIVKLFHPDIPEESPTNKGLVSTKDRKLSANVKYDWVVIVFRVRGWGIVSIGINNCHQYKLFGPKITKEDMSKALKDGTCTLRTWRFCMDKKSSSTKIGAEEEECCKQAVELLKSRGYKLQSVEEMYEIYYSD
jgi:hypothetical protein